jgi:hypothetical protein
VCVVLCAVFRLIVVLFCMMCVVCVLCLIVVPLPPGENPFEVKINNNDNKFGARGSVVVKAPCCKPEGRGFKSR